MKQTAVSFLLRELRIEDLAKGEQLSVVLQICEEAKAMEKEQITQSFVGGADFREMNKHHNRSAASYADQYYRTNFKTKIEW